jgi:hypothetical protein
MGDALKYLEAVVPWDDGNYVGIHYRFLPSGSNELKHDGFPFRDIGDAMRKVSSLSRWEPARDIYVAIASQREVRAKQARNGQDRLEAIATVENAAKAKSFFIDLDVGPDQAFKTTSEAVAAMKKFLADSGMPQLTSVVLSGSGGLHLCYICEEAMDVADEWQWMADALVNAMKTHGLKADYQVTCQAHRKLRIPGTFNYSVDPPQEVVLKNLRAPIPNQELQDALLPYKVTTRPTVLPDELAQGWDAPKEAKPRNIEDVRRVCAWVDQSIENGGEDNDHQLRLDAYLLSIFCENSRDVAWSMMSNRETLDDAEFDLKFEETVARQQEKGMGFPSCHAISMHGAAQCSGCPHFSKGKGPLSLVAPGTVISTKVKSPYIVAPYSEDENGLIWKSEIIEEDGVQRTESYIVFPYPIRDPWMSRLEGKFYLNFHTTIATRWEQVAIPMAATASKDKFRAALAEVAGMSVDVDRNTMEFAVSFLQKLQSAKEGVLTLNPFGWNYEDGVFTGFTFAGKCYTQSDVRPAPPCDPGLRALYKVEGNEAHWIAVAEAMTKQKRPDLDAIIAMSFGAPLVHLLGGAVEGVVVGAVSSESGIGKSTAMKVAQAVWGDPFAASGGQTDTINSTFGRIGTIRNLPYFWDEIKSQQQTKNFVEIIFQLSSGREKSRMGRDTRLREQKTWQTGLVYASNESLYGAVLAQTGTTTAGHMRLFEYNVKPIPDGMSDPELNRLVGLLKQNHGVVGARYSKFLAENFSDLTTRAQNEVDRWTERLKSKPEHRFWVGACAVIFMGAELANEQGFTKFDLPTLEEFLVTEFERMAQKAATAPNDLSHTINVAALFGDFLSDNSVQHTIFTNIVYNNRGKPRAGAVTVTNEGTVRFSKLTDIQVQVGKDGVIRFSDSALSDFCKRRNISKETFAGALEKKFFAKPSFGRMASGTNYADTVTRPIWQLCYKGTELEDFIEGMDEDDMPQPMAAMG